MIDFNNTPFYIISLFQLTEKTHSKEVVFLRTDTSPDKPEYPNFIFNHLSLNYIEPIDFLNKNKLIFNQPWLHPFDTTYLDCILSINKYKKHIDMSNFDPTIYKVYFDTEESFIFYIELNKSKNIYLPIYIPLKLDNITLY